MVKMILTGNESAAWGARLSRPKVVAAYPITPQTSIIETIADFIANGEMDARYIRVESEHSAMAACIAAQNTGVRTFTATSAHGLTLMHELLIWASGARLPIVMSVVNRAMAPPWSVWTDQMDSMAQRDTGWIQIYTENNQEVLDSIIMSYRIGEKHHILLPTMVMEDAFILSHTSEGVDVPEQKLVDDFLGEYDPAFKLEPGNPEGYGSLIMPEGPYMEFRYKMARAMDDARKEIRKTVEEFAEVFGREYAPLIEEYRTEDADAIMVVLGTIGSTAKDIVDRMREKGKKVGLARVRYFRPFPYEEIRSLAKKTKMLGIVDRSYTFGYGADLYTESKAALYGHSGVPVKNYVMGLGGRDITPNILIKVFDDMLKIAKEEHVDREIEWVGLHGDERWS
ncbi:2-oxoacid:ferredoxin oxidoreductase, alpha subunit [Aciduliprofundum sp. MAR08-339]|uniref:2-oxoacid:ferredoxin oxidoreductase subunit alpha n=1 Tax=Aciduliprofundum sp. (strain MAR08-339) TaxID=673860 RepID=UPI0002A4C1C3|nr:2-oxoacid:ferredoxin oxidoreductase, alpha subunit [Aciduliprofundum sp. MAR08-339]